MNHALIVLCAAAGLGLGCANPSVSCATNAERACVCTAHESDQITLGQCHGALNEYCCADGDYPAAAGARCLCRFYACTVGANDCECSTTIALETSVTQTAAECPSTFTRCCDDGDSCACDSSTAACPTGQAPVAHCGTPFKACGASQSVVTSCGSAYEM